MAAKAEGSNNHSYTQKLHWPTMWLAFSGLEFLVAIRQLIKFLNFALTSKKVDKPVKIIVIDKNVIY